MIELRVLGTLDLHDPDNGDLGSVLARPKLLALLVYLALARPNGFRNRDMLLGLFWPESGQARARHALNQALYELRKALGEGAVVSRGDDEVGLDRARFWCDAEAYEQRLKAGDRRQALELYAGDLLGGFALSGCEEFEAWLDERREGLRLRALEALRAEAERLAAVGEHGEAAYWLRRGLRWEPYDEDLARRLLEALLASGDRTGTLREYETFTRRLAEELGVEPSPEVSVLAELARTNGNGGGARGNGAEANGALAMAANGPVEVLASERSGFGHRAALVLGILAIVAAIGIAPLFRRDSAPAAPDTRRVLVAGFENRTGDPELDDLSFMAAEWIAQELSGTGLVRPTLPMRGAGGAAVTDPFSAALQSGSGLVLKGSYDLEGDSIVFQASVVRVPGGEVVRAIGRIAGPRSDPGTVVDRLRQRTTGILAALVDERLAASVTAASSQAPSYDAYRSFAEGIVLHSRRQYRAAAAAFDRAAAYDSTFTAPLVYAALAHDNAIYYPDETRRDPRQVQLGDSVRAYLTARRDRLPVWEAAWVDFWESEQNRPAAFDAMKRITDMTPEPEWLQWQAGILASMNRHREALEIFERLDPEQPGMPEWNRQYLGMVMSLNHSLGNYEREYALLQEFRRRYPAVRPVPPRSFAPEYLEVRALAGLGRKADLLREMQNWQRIASDPGEVVGMPAMEAMIHGHEDVARETWEWFLEQDYEPEDDDDPEELWRWGPASALLFLGRGEEARVYYERLLERARPSSDNRIMFMGALGQIAADRGDRAQAMEYDRRLAAIEHEFPEIWIPGAIESERIKIAIALGEHDRALDMMEAAGARGRHFNDHPMFHLRFLELRGNPRYEALVRPR